MTRFINACEYSRYLSTARSVGGKLFSHLFHGVVTLVAACEYSRDFQRSLIKEYFREYSQAAKRLLSSSCIRCAHRLIRTEVITRVIGLYTNITYNRQNIFPEILKKKMSKYPKKFYKYL